jgi:predicted DNA-binding ribbon-helix-helix protein
LAARLVTYDTPKTKSFLVLFFKKEQLSSLLIKRSFSLAGHRTSIALEGPFWDALAAIAARDGLTLSGLVARVDGARGADTKLASALRVLALREAARSRHA